MVFQQLQVSLLMLGGQRMGIKVLLGGDLNVLQVDLGPLTRIRWKGNGRIPFLTGRRQNLTPAALLSPKIIPGTLPGRMRAGKDKVLVPGSHLLGCGRQERVRYPSPGDRPPSPAARARRCRGTGWSHWRLPFIFER